MRTLVSAMIVLATLAHTGCSSGGANGQGSETASATPGTAAAEPATAATPAPRPAARNAPRRQPAAKANLPKSPDVSILKLDQSEVPAAVRAIEHLVDRRSALLADEVRIEVSKNYEWDVSLSGDGVSPQRPDRGGTLSEADGNARAYFRNLDIRSRGKITVWRSGLGVTPFIKIYARGGVSYIDTDDATGKPRVQRANACQITNAKIAFDNQLIGMPGDAAAQPAAARERAR
jgi:hypothetical protein